MTENEMLEWIKKQIKEAEMVLVGVGEELDTKIIQTEEATPEELFFERCSLVEKKQNGELKNKALLSLASLLKGKNYFVISTNADECLYCSGFREGYIVTPCGRETLFQCSENCSDRVWSNAEYLQSLHSLNRKAETEENIEETEKRKEVEEAKQKTEKNYWKLPLCPDCSSNIAFNIINPKQRETYCEKGYLSDWERYMKWLSGTLNRKLFLLELGVGFAYPQLIRWAFERTALLNEKAYLIRAHESLANIPAELKEKAEGFSIHAGKLLCQSA